MRRGVTASGVTGQIDGVEYRLGKPAFVSNGWMSRSPSPETGSGLPWPGGDELLAWFRIDSPLREGAEALVDGLQQAG
jgi:P-type Cu2+ transporter